MSRTSVLFVCMGNICRSPAAEGVFRHLAAQAGVLAQFSVDSCGTGGWHAGERADARMRDAAAERGYKLSSRARQITSEDLTAFDVILCMDGDNMRDVLAMGGDDRVSLILDEGKVSVRDVPDPYYGGDAGFEQVMDLLEASCAALLERLRS